MFTAPAAMRSTGETFTFLPMLSALAVMNALARDWCEYPRRRTFDVPPDLLREYGNGMRFTGGSLADDFGQFAVIPDCLEYGRRAVSLWRIGLGEQGT